MYDGSMKLRPYISNRNTDLFAFSFKDLALNVTSRHSLFCRPYAVIGALSTCISSKNIYIQPDGFNRSFVPCCTIQVVDLFLFSRAILAGGSASDASFSSPLTSRTKVC